MAKHPQARLRPEDRRFELRPLGLVLGVVVLFSVLAWGVYQLTEPSVLPVRKVRVGGALAHVDQTLLKRTVVPYAEAGFLRVDLNSVREAVESLPWVDSASVRRAWPDMLDIRISEQKAVAQWEDFALVNSRGELFSPPRDQWPGGLPKLGGPPAKAVEIASRFNEVQAMFAQLSLKVSALTQDQRRSWHLRLNNGIALSLGRNHTTARLARFIRVYPRVLAAKAGQIAGVDLRYTNGFAVAWRQETGAGA